MRYFLALLCAVLFAVSAQAQTSIAARDAKSHIGETVTVADKVFGGKLLSSNMTLIDLGAHYPNEELTIMIPAASREKFSGKPESDWVGKTVTVTGKVIDYKGKPEIVLTDPSQVKILVRN